MAYFAELNADNLVLRVVSINNSDCLNSDGVEDEAVGVAYCQHLFGGDTIWKQTSFNTIAGKHLNGGQPLRMNYAGIGYRYNPERDAFIPPKPKTGDWKFDDATCTWIFAGQAAP